ncbi:Ig-like domain-containing protein [Gordonia sp. NB41Y]|uniref:L,D-transpeptidase n=1 Tax=Gordonia sp. NB41Y TaxID=875808 RepID=UPI0006B1F3FE|nr:Ig-like domain-containing protein [Gordonia sp. NB41Y]KOY50042.1 ErfK/YbiS/YcfS/YnhG family protein [Gordonia sp. NB41Y]
MIPARGHRARNALLLLTVGAAVTVMPGCTASSSYPDTVGDVPALSSLGQPTIDVTGWGNRPVRDDAVGVMPGAPLTVTAHEGGLTSVTVAGPDGPVAGTMSSDGATWTATDGLDFGTHYTLTAAADGVQGTGARKLGFSTASADSTASATSVTDDGETVGVGQPVMINFDQPITDKKNAQQAITVTTDPPVQGAFYWVNDSMVRWRPEHFWKPGTKVSVKVNTKGIDLGDGVYGDNTLNTHFTVGRSFVAAADDKTHMITITVNGKVVKTMPTSMGKDSTPTNNGTYIVAEREPSVIMDSSTYGVPVNSAGGYREVVYDATRISYSGIYVHSAPWSLGDQGVDDVSNGCLNVSPENAEWFLQHAKRGDIVTVKNAVGPTLPGDDGLGDWNVPWSVWSKGNA